MKQLQILSDFHHASLLQSLILLFEKRLGGELYRPIGMEWHEQGYWAVYDHPATALQFLTLDQGYKPVDGTPPLNQILTHRDGIYLCNDIAKEHPNKAITLDAFKQTKFDILIASMPQHIEPFHRLIDLYQPQAKLIYQVGNQWNIDGNLVKNVMASAKVDLPQGINSVTMHQEFDLDVFHYGEPTREKKIYSFINCLGVVDIYKKDWELFLELERLMPDWEFQSMGGQCRDSSINDSKALADKMREATFIFHCKSEGDGFGHVIHNAAAVGRPLIARFSDYQGKLAEPFVRHGSSVIVDGKDAKSISDEIQKLYKQNTYTRMGEYIHSTFEKTVNFDAEEQQIRAFLEKLQ